MASFVETAIPQFNPYIQQLPIETMAAVGMEKQRRYDEGIQRIQSQIDQVAGLDVYRPQDKQHLQSKLNELGTKLRTVAAGDFSNYQLVNSTAGMAANVAKDPVVLAAVQSTAVIRKNGQIMEEARQKGELTPDNEKYYNKFLNRYLESGLTDDRGKPITFNGRYIPNFDIFKFAKETFDAVKPDNMTWDEVYEIDPSTGKPKTDKRGNLIYSPVMIRMEKEGRFPQKVKETIDQIFSDPRVGQQLQITGEYNYQGYDPNMLKTRLVGQQTAIVNSMNEEIAKLNLKKSSTTNADEKAQIDMAIQSVQNSIARTKEGYTKLFETADANPDAVRGMLHMDDVRNRYTTMFGQMITKQTTTDNPGWQANFKLQEAAWDRQKFAIDMAYKRERAGVEDQQWMLTYQQKERELATKVAKNKLAPDSTELANQSAAFNTVAETYARADRAANTFNSASDNLLWKAYYSSNPQTNKRYQDLVNGGNSPQEAISVMIQQDAKEAGMSVPEFRTNKLQQAIAELNRKGVEKLPNDVADALRQYNTSKKASEDANFVKEQLDKASSGMLNETLGKLYQGDEIKPQTIDFRGQKVQLSKQDIIDLGVYLRGYNDVWGFMRDDVVTSASKAAEDRLMRTGKGEILDYIKRVDITRNSPVSKTIKSIGSPIDTVRDIWNIAWGDTNFDVSQIEKVFNAIDNDKYTEGLKRQNEIANKFQVTAPNLKAGVFTGDSDTDRGLLYDLKRITAGYSTVGNVSPDYKEFAEHISGVTDPKDLNLETIVTNVPGGAPNVEIVAYADGERVGGVTIQPDEASNFIDTSDLYVPENMTILQNRVNMMGSSSSGDPDDPYTYMTGDAAFQKSTGDFPNLKGLQGYDVMANIVNSNDGYYGKIFIRNLETGKIYDMETTEKNDFSTVYNTLQAISPSEIMSVVFNSGKK